MNKNSCLVGLVSVIGFVALTVSALSAKPARADSPVTLPQAFTVVTADLTGISLSQDRVSTTKISKASLKRISGHTTSCTTRSLLAGTHARLASNQTVKICL
jgi:hypothetical protein